MVLTLFSLLGEAGHLQEYQSQLVAEQAALLQVGETSVDAQSSAIPRHHEIGKRYDVHCLDVVVPGGALLTQPDDGLGGIVEHPLLEVGVLAVLHLHDDFLPAARLAKYVVDGRAVAVEHCLLLLVEEREIGDDVLPVKQGVEEIEQAWLGELLPEDYLEAHVCERVDEFSHNLLQLLGKGTFYFFNGKTFRSLF